MSLLLGWDIVLSIAGASVVMLRDPAHGSNEWDCVRTEHLGCKALGVWMKFYSALGGSVAIVVGFARSSDGMFMSSAWRHLDRLFARIPHL